MIYERNYSLDCRSRLPAELASAFYVRLGLLCIMGLGCPLIWKSIGGWILFALYLLGNIPFILIQRYNRPKLVRLLKRLQLREIADNRKEQETTYEESSDIKLQYGARA